MYCMATTGPAGLSHVNSLRAPAVLLSDWWFCLKISTLSDGKIVRVSPCNFYHARRAIHIIGLKCIIRGKTGYTHSVSPSRPPNNTLNTRQQHQIHRGSMPQLGFGIGWAC